MKITDDRAERLRHVIAPEDVDMADLLDDRAEMQATIAAFRAIVEELRPLHERGTEAPWRVGTDEPGDVVIWGPREDWQANVGNWARQNPGATAEEAACQLAEMRDAADAALIVALRNAVPRMVGLVGRTD